MHYYRVLSVFHEWVSLFSKEMCCIQNTTVLLTSEDLNKTVRCFFCYISFILFKENHVQIANFHLQCQVLFILFSQTLIVWCSFCNLWPAFCPPRVDFDTMSRIAFTVDRASHWTKRRCSFQSIIRSKKYNVWDQKSSAPDGWGCRCPGRFVSLN